MLGEDDVLHGTHHAADEPVQGQTGGDSEANVQAHQGEHEQHHLTLLSGLGLGHSLLVLNTLVVGNNGVIGLLGDQHLQHLAAGRQHGHQEQADVGPGPGFPLEHVEHGLSAQVNAQEVEVDALQGTLGNAGDGGLDLLSVHGDVLSGLNLCIIIVASKQIGVNALDGFHDQIGVLCGFAQQVTDGLTDHGEQRDEDQQGNQAPQTAAAAHACAFFLLQLLDGFVLLLLIVCVFTLNFLNSGLKTGHLHHTLFALHGNGQKDHLHQEGKENHCQTVVAQQAVQLIQQPAERYGDNIGQFKCQKHRHTSYWLSWYGVKIRVFGKGMAAHQALESQPSTLKGTVFRNSLHRIGGTGGAVAAARGEGGGNLSLVEADHFQHDFLHGETSCMGSSFKNPALAASDKKAAVRTEKSAEMARVRATTTISQPGRNFSSFRR